MRESTLPLLFYPNIFFFSFDMKSIKYLNFIAISLAVLSVIMMLMYLFGISLVPDVFLVISVMVSLSVSFLSTLLTMALSFRDENK